MKRPGRNDPCHCGSGKKYKNCHLDEDQRSHAAMRSPQPEAQAGYASSAIPELSRIMQGSFGRRLRRKDKHFAELWSRSAPILEYTARQEEIEAAAAELEPRREEFERLAADEDQYCDLARTLFAEECFIPLRFTAADVEGAFNQVGYPATMSPDDGTVEILRAAILHVADQERRHRSAVSLLLHLPEFVARGRHLEAWLLQGMAYETMEHGQNSNPFLYEMFSYGYDAWAAEKRVRNESLVRKLGFDLDELRAMKPDELDACIRSRGADPEGEGVLEAFFNENPQLREESVANIQALERNSRKLLDREDARFLLIPDEEVQPWLRLLHQRSIEAGWPDPSLGEALSEEDGKRIFESVALPLMREMANAIFTPDRIRGLVADLRKYRGERLTANDLDTAALAMGAICYLEREDDPGLNTFLLGLCGASTDASVQAMCDSPGGASPEAP